MTVTELQDLYRTIQGSDAPAKEKIVGLIRSELERQEKYPWMDKVLPFLDRCNTTYRMTMESVFVNGGEVADKFTKAYGEGVGLKVMELMK